ncbi:ABC-2 type transport system permease protein [Granulicella pectinivorans]|jgi:ABC-2 type transport system permease protein|uniref:Transport permease protein n=1 Tax=Granulicella pectinivorans TaxID=474950 RepID=A0A1I6LQV6_9BACT|nr:ABC transporter permease [Granulicella pectinivorans]SFS05875.1 ABC-2 type transport system permease protein [Granulicella pectinivorans]
MATSALYPVAGTAPVVNIFVKETKYEFLKLLRTRSFSAATIGFPVMFYLLFGVANRHGIEGGVHIAKYMLASYAVFGLVGSALFGIGVGMAGERAAGWLEVKQASPMPPAAYLFAKCMAAIAFGLIIVSILTTIGVTMAGVSLSGVELAKMMAFTVAGSTAFASMGLLLALVVPANAAPGIVNLIYLPMSFLSGLWVPLHFLPRWLQAFAPVLPTYHLSQLMQSIFGYQEPDVAVSTHWLALAGFTMLMLGTSWLVFNRSQKNA